MQHRTQRTAQTVGLMRAMGAAEKRKAVPRPVYPMLIETEYAKKVVALINRGDAALANLRAAMPRLLTASNMSLRSDAGETEFAQKLIDEAREKMDATITRDDALALAKFAGDRTSIAQRADLQKQLRAGLGIEVPLNETRIKEMLINFANQNAQLIGTIPSRQLDDVANLTMRAFTKRMTPETFAAELQKIADVTEGKARQIARDQIGTLTGQLSEERQRELGIDGYFWMTRLDPHVRPLHRAREGKRFAWDEPPSDGHPGIPYGCRCTAKPDLSRVLQTIAKSQSTSRPNL